MSMETDSPVVYHGTSESRFPKNEIHKIVMELTNEEKEVFRQCNRESLYYRCFPFAAAGMTAVHFAARKGFITPNPLWGITGPMLGAMFMGWLLGKLSYKSVCEDKFLQLENSNIGNAIRKKRGYSLEKYQNGFVKSKPSEDDLTLKDDSFIYYSDSDYHSSTGSLNLDMDKNIQYSGLDDRERPSTDREVLQITEEPEPAKRFTTYEDLRKRNRDEYERLQRPPYSSGIGPVTTPGSYRSWNNLDNMQTRRLNPSSDEGEKKSTDGDNWDKAKLL